MTEKDFQASKLRDLRSRWQRLNEIAGRLRKQSDGETRVEERMRLEPLIEEKEEERDRVEAEIRRLETALPASLAPSEDAAPGLAPKSATAGTPVVGEKARRTTRPCDGHRRVVGREEPKDPYTLTLHIHGSGEEPGSELARGELEKKQKFSCHFELSGEEERNNSGDFASPWSDDNLRGLRRLLRGRTSDPARLRHAGQELRTALKGVPGLDEAMAFFGKGERRSLIIRAHDERVLRLPWELLTLELGPSAAYFVTRPGSSIERRLSLREERRRPGVDQAQGAFLFAWSEAGGEVPHVAHTEVLQEVCGDAGVEFDVVDDASLKSIAEKAAELWKKGSPVSYLHLLCHGKQVASSADVWGLALKQPSGDDRPFVADPVQLAVTIDNYLKKLSLLSLHACDAANPGGPPIEGEVPNLLGSAAEAAWTTGVTVVASQFPLTKGGSKVAVKTFFSELFAGKDVADAMQRVVANLSRDVDSKYHDWASLVLMQPD